MSTTRISNMISYLYPVIVETRRGNVTPYLEVTRHRGKYLLNSSHVNYSFGGLHLLFDELFKRMSIRNYSFKNALLLGMGAGSVISLLREKYGLNCPVTAIEKDEVVIDLAAKYFEIRRFTDLTVINMDAFTYVKDCRQKFDLVIVDVFVGDSVPAQFATFDFLMDMKHLLMSRACVIYNKMTQTPQQQREFSIFTERFAGLFPLQQVFELTFNGSKNSVLTSNNMSLFSNDKSTAVYAQGI